MHHLTVISLAVLAAVLVTMTDAGDPNVHVHEHVAGNDEVGQKVDGYVVHDTPVLPYEVSAEEKRYEDDPEGGADVEDDH